ncbi:efflux RND transporter permease subunit [Phocaeicola oris]|uniref:efflux RND transporter permease subunit n=1 Tax=Phocaeicola oris TaxID=2896850 RepID=UPI00234F48E8|nr:efflux RND transporter permease subunit [Phocaeicola oris]MCE2617493.1 efflux RND transporter permease subunit [Phocaeicola oris]
MNKRNHISAFTLIVIFVCLSLIGIALIPLLPIKLVPSRTLPGLSVSYNMRGSSSRIVEMEVTSKLEGILARINGVKNITSTSSNESGSVSIEFDKHTDMEIARFEVSTAIRQLWPQLPDEVAYPQISENYSDDDASRPFLVYTLNAPQEPILIQQYAEDHIKNKIGQLKGVYKVEINGATPMEWQLEYSSDQLNQLGISPYDIINAIHENYDSEFLGISPYKNENGKTEWIRLIRMSTIDKQEFIPSSILLKTKDSTLISLDKVITAKHIESAPQSYYRINGLNSVYLNITANETANQINLSKQVKKIIADCELNMPPGYEIHLNYDATKYIDQELQKIYFRTGLTVFILLVFVLLVTWRLKYLFLIVMSITVNLLVAVIFYYLSGIEIQLYSLAGITISLNLMIDATIIMTDHIVHRHNIKAFMSVLAATLTTVGALSIIFFLDEKIKLNLQDFAAVVIINLIVSLFVALFFVPSLIEKIGLDEKRNIQLKTRTKRLTVYFTNFYQKLISWLCRYKVVAFILLILIFGIPTFLLPEKIDGEGKGATIYNKIFDTKLYKETIKPITDKVLGGTLRLFIQDVYNGSYFNRDQGEVILSVYANMPNGTTLDQMNELIKKMEIYLTQYKEIRQFQTAIYSPKRASIQIYFTKASERSVFPYTLKSNIISKALTIGGGSWEVYGLQDQGFSNDVRENAGSFQIKMYGFNYDELYHQAEILKSKLLEHRRIKEVLINSEFFWWKNDYQEYFLNLNKEQMAQKGISASQLFNTLTPIFGKDIYVSNILFGKQLEQLKLSSLQSKEYDVWGLMNMPLTINKKTYKLSDFATLQKEQSPQDVVKEDQQYTLCLQYEYIGAQEQGKKLLEKDLKAFNATLPMGYKAENKEFNYSWGQKNYKESALLFLVIAIIFFITGILFNSLKQPLAIIFVIPISYIGVFLTFYLFQLNFDQGGFASFVLLCGITVNASIYILNEYNNIRKVHPKQPVLVSYTKAWNAKIIPIFLTIVSTALGFIPFMVGTLKEGFWFPLAAGTIGGLIMSVIGIFFYLPMFVIKLKSAN